MKQLFSVIYETVFQDYIDGACFIVDTFNGGSATPVIGFNLCRVFNGFGGYGGRFCRTD
jgi:hypothetical protein